MDGNAAAPCPGAGPGPGRTSSSGPQPPETVSQPAAPLHSDCSFQVNEPVSYTETSLEGGRPASFVGPLPMMFFSPPVRTRLADYDLFVPWSATGWIDESGNCVPKNGTAFWHQPCAQPFPSPGINGCVIQVMHLPPNGPPPTLADLGLDPRTLLGNVEGTVRPGTITSSPARLGLVNTATCFYVNGMNNLQPQHLQVVLQANFEPPPYNRGLYYTFRIEVSQTRTRWDFGDNSSAETAPDPRCLGSGQIATAHWYTNYSSSQSDNGAFQVTMTESYTAHVVEYWYDTQPEAMDLGDGGIPPFDLVAGPVPMAVIQEEGVPVVP